jgi:hypothetical protein
MTQQPAFQPRVAADFMQPAASAPLSAAGGASSSPIQPRRKRKVFMLGGGIALALALVGGYVFGLYLPNTPPNVYETGINRSGKALNALITSATEQKQLESYDTSSIKGSVVAKLGEEGTYSGDFTTTFDKTAMNGGLNVQLTAKDEPTKTISLKAMSKLASGSMYPDAWFQFTGLESSGLSDFAPGIADYEGKWISVSSDYLKSLGANYGVAGGDNTKEEVTAADIAELARTSATVTQQYLFSSEPTKAVLIQKSYVGKERMDGLTTYHYKIGINTNHAKDYCVALSNAVLSTKAAKKLSGSGDKEIADGKQSAEKDCPKLVSESVKSGDTYDMWIDGKYKLIHKIRIYDKNDKKSYTDVGQTYLGGDKLSLFTNFHDDKNMTDGTFTLDTNIKAAKTSGVLTIKSNDKDSPYDVTVKLSAEASSKPVSITPPSSSIPIQDILKKMGFDQNSVADLADGDDSSTQGSAADIERKADISELAAQIETFYTNESRYPTLAELNNAKWRSSNMPGLSAGSIQPPSSKAATIAATASTTQYGYAPDACSGSDGCQGYVLTAILDNGEKYQKKGYDASDIAT